MIIKAVQEVSITDLQRSVASLRAEYGTAIEQSRVGDCNSNGRVERARAEGTHAHAPIGRQRNDPAACTLGRSISAVDGSRHAAHIINVCRVRPDGRTAWQAMKGRRTNSKLLPFAETVLFKIPKTHHRIGSFENRWEIGCWVGVVARSGEQIVATPTGV